MHSRLFRTILPLPFSVHKFSRKISVMEKMNDDGLKGEPPTDSVASDEKVGGYSRLGQTSNEQNYKPSSILDDDEFPSLSASMALCHKNKRGGKIELRKTVEPASEIKAIDNDLLQPRTEFDESLIPGSFGKKKCIRRVRQQPTLKSSREVDKSFSPTNFKNIPRFGKQPPFKSSGEVDESFSPTNFENKDIPRFGRADDRPFDICVPKRQRSFELKPSLKGNRWVKRQDMVDSCEKIGEVLRPGMVLLKGYISLKDQVEIVSKCREVGIGPGGFYRPSYKYGAKLSLQMMCFGLNWDPQTRNYSKERPTDHSKTPDIPQEFSDLSEKAIRDSHELIKEHFNVSNADDILPMMSPDICIVNFYSTSGRLGLHQDRDETPDSRLRGLPVVSFSIGDSAEFLYGEERDINKAEKVVLESGDVLIFGGKSRNVFHGVTSIFPGSAPPSLLELSNLRPGRLNLTFRKY